ncbi:RICIN domain-containing protein [Kitasatospora sp. NPDC085464]|uniref:RICIN domain-containing protein n=1 Tax=Kitasatospora sp. NPDC085464 TaxID=3364063 RepID=UPI0037C52AA0
MPEPAAAPPPGTAHSRRSPARALTTRHHHGEHGPPGPGDTTPRTRAANTAEKASPILQAFRQLPEAVRAELARHLEAPTEADPGTSSADGRIVPVPVPVPVPDPRLVRRFYDTRLRFHALHTPRRDCRQLVARLGDTVLRGHRDDHLLEVHLARCTDCDRTRTRTELTAIHAWQRTTLQRALLPGTGGPAPGPSTATAAQSAPEGSHPATSVRAPRASPRRRRPAAAGHRPRPSDRTIMVGLIVLGLGVLIVAAAAAAAPQLPAPPDTAAHPAPPANPPSGPPSNPPSVSSPARPPASPGVPPPPSPSHPGSPTAAAPGRSGAAPGPSARADSSGAPPTGQPAGTTGLRLVNLRSGLCVTPGDGDGSGVRLETCTGGDAQRWRLVRDDADGLYRIRHAADERCLDGTSGGGNTVAAVLRDCLAGRREQLWTVLPDKDSGAFRIRFAPPVGSSDYGEHLLGPRDIWPGPAKADSPSSTNRTTTARTTSSSPRRTDRD